MEHQPPGHLLESLGAVFEPTQNGKYHHQFRPESVEMAVIIVTEGGKEAIPEIKKRLGVEKLLSFPQPRKRVTSAMVPSSPRWPALVGRAFLRT